MTWLISLLILSAQALPDKTQEKVDDYLRMSEAKSAQTEVAGLKKKLEDVGYSLSGLQQDITDFNEANELVFKEIRRIRRDYDQPFMSEDELYTHLKDRDSGDESDGPPINETMGSYYCRLQSDPGFCQSQQKYFQSIHWNAGEYHETAFSDEKDAHKDD